QPSPVNTLYQLALPYYPNLISNTSFEEMFSCPSGSNNISDSRTDVCHWNSPVNLAHPWGPATPDYFNTCANNIPNSGRGVPNNNLGHQTPHNGGGAYAGFSAFTFTNPTVSYHDDYREYLRQVLPADRALQAGKRYYGEY